MQISPSQKAELTAEYNRSAGEIMRNWAEFEIVLIFYFRVLSQMQDEFRARVIWASLPNLQARRKLLNRLAVNYLDDPALKKFQKFMKRMSSLGGKRNLIAHAPSGVMDDGKVNFTRADDDDTDGTFKFMNQEIYSLENVKGWAPAIKTLMVDMMNFISDFQSDVHASSKIHREQP